MKVYHNYFQGGNWYRPAMFITLWATGWNFFANACRSSLF